MTNKEILEKAIQKAIDGGWKVTNPTIDTPEKIMDWYAYPDSFREDYCNRFIFNHDFAKALWGEEQTKYTYLIDKPLEHPVSKDDPIWYAENRFTELWKLKLMQMVISPDPIKYLGDNI